MRLTSLPIIRQARDDATRRVIVEYLQRYRSIPAAADALGCARETLQRWCGRLGIDTWEATGRERPVSQNVTDGGENCHRKSTGKTGQVQSVQVLGGANCHCDGAGGSAKCAESLV